MEMKTFVSTNNEDISESLVNISVISIHQISSKDIDTKCHQYMNENPLTCFKPVHKLHYRTKSYNRLRLAVYVYLEHGSNI